MNVKTLNILAMKPMDWVQIGNILVSSTILDGKLDFETLHQPIALP
jgi:hypothetical protein